MRINPSGNIAGDTGYITGPFVDQLAQVIEKDLVEQISICIKEKGSLSQDDLEYIISSNHLIRKISGAKYKINLGNIK
jgi:hypothetical protein